MFRVPPILATWVPISTVGLLFISVMPSPAIADVDEQQSVADEIRTLDDFVELSRQNQDQYEEEFIEKTSAEELTDEALLLYGIDELTSTEAERLAEFSGDSIILPDLSELSSETATALTNWDGTELWMGGLRDIEADILEILVEWGKVESHNPAFDREYRRTDRHLHLNGLETLDSSSAEVLANWKGESLSLRGLEQINVETASHLAELDTKFLDLSGLANLDAETASELARWKDRGRGAHQLLLDGLEELHPDSAEALAKWGDDWEWESARWRILSLNGLVELSDETSAVLGEWDSGRRGSLRLNGVRQLSTDQALGLSAFQGNLYLRGIEEVTVPTADALAEGNARFLVLMGLERFGVDTAEALAEWDGWILELGGDWGLTNALARALAEMEINKLRLFNVEELNGESATPFQLFSGRLSFPNLQRLDSKAAEVLVDRKNNRREVSVFGYHSAEPQTTEIERFALNSVEIIDAAVAAELTEWDGNELMLNGVRTLDEESAMTFAEWNGSILHLEGLESLSSAAAVQLARFDGEIKVSETIAEMLDEHR